MFRLNLVLFLLLDLDPITKTLITKSRVTTSFSIQFYLARMRSERLASKATYCRIQQFAGFQHFLLYTIFYNTAPDRDRGPSLRVTVTELER